MRKLLLIGLVEFAVAWMIGARPLLAQEFSLTLPLRFFRMPITQTITTPEGVILGTRTSSGDGIVYYRDAKGQIAGSARMIAGEYVLYDPSGNVTDAIMLGNNPVKE